jgi:hypothetical protein
MQSTEGVLSRLFIRDNTQQRGAGRAWKAFGRPPLLAVARCLPGTQMADEHE